MSQWIKMFIKPESCDWDRVCKNLKSTIQIRNEIEILNNKYILKCMIK